MQEELAKSEAESSAVENEFDYEHNLQRKLSNSLVGENVHASYSSKKEKDRWRKRPLFNRAGFSAVFKSGTDAATLLVQEARRRDPYQGDFLDAVEDIIFDLAPAIEEDPRRAWIFKQLMEPEYLYTFRVPWKDDHHNSRINRGIMIQYSSALGPYNGDIAFSQNLSHGLSRMMGWEQTLRSSIASKGVDEFLPNEKDDITSFGGMMCGSDFDPEEKTESEVRAFSTNFMDVLAPLINGNETPSLIETGLKVGRREIGFLRRSYEVSRHRGKEIFGSSSTFPECKGYGCVYFAERALENHLHKKMKGLRCIVSGSGLLSRNIAKKLIDLGAKPLTLSDDSGIIYAKDGLTFKDLEMAEKFRRNNSPLSDFARTTSSHLKFIPDVNLFRQEIDADVVFAAKAMGEVNVDDATFLEDRDVIAVFECLDKGVTTNARILLADREVLFAPAKAVGGGTVIATGFAHKYHETHGKDPSFAEVDTKLRQRMIEIQDEVTAIAELYAQPGNLKAGANLLSFLRIAKKESL